jgi:hypothetical protein
MGFLNLKLSCGGRTRYHTHVQIGIFELWHKGTLHTIDDKKIPDKLIYGSQPTMYEVSSFHNNTFLEPYTIIFK